MGGMVEDRIHQYGAFGTRELCEASIVSLFRLGFHQGLPNVKAILPVFKTKELFSRSGMRYRMVSGGNSLPWKYPTTTRLATLKSSTSFLLQSKLSSLKLDINGSWNGSASIQVGLQTPSSCREGELCSVCLHISHEI